MSTRTLLAAMATASALVVAGCGSDDEPSSAGNPTDRAFVAEMIPHHESAVDMAEIAQERGESPFVKKLAGDIVRTQSSELTTLCTQDKQLAEAGVKPGSLGMSHSMMGMDGDTAMLKTAEPFDAAFLKMMIPHHEGALEMAKVELDKGQDPELKKLAQQIIDAQQREIAEMREEA